MKVTGPGIDEYRRRGGVGAGSRISDVTARRLRLGRKVGMIERGGCPRRSKGQTGAYVLPAGDPSTPGDEIRGADVHRGLLARAERPGRRYVQPVARGRYSGDVSDGCGTTGGQIVE